MKSFIAKLTLATAVLASSSVFASTTTVPVLANDGKTASTGLFEVAGDGSVGLSNIGGSGSNTLFNEQTFEFTTGNEVYVAMINGPLAAATQGVHVDGKGTVFFANTDGATGTCEEYIIPKMDVSTSFDTSTNAFKKTLAIPSTDLEQVTGCTPV